MISETPHLIREDVIITRIQRLHFNESTGEVHRENILVDKLSERGISVKPEIIDTLVNMLNLVIREPVDFIFKTNAGNVIFSSVGSQKSLDKEGRTEYEERRNSGMLPEHCVVIRDIQRLYEAYINLLTWSQAQNQKNKWLMDSFYGLFLQVASKNDLENFELYLEKVLTRMKNGHLVSDTIELGQTTTKDGLPELLSVGSMDSHSGNESPFKLVFHTLNLTTQQREQLPSVYYAIDQPVTDDLADFSRVSIFAIQDEPIVEYVTPKRLEILERQGIADLITSVNEKIFQELQLRTDERSFATVQEIDQLLEEYLTVEKTERLVAYLRAKRLYLLHDDYKKAFQERTENRRRYNKGLNGGGAHLLSFFSAICLLKKQGYKTVNLETSVPFGSHRMHDASDLDERNELLGRMMNHLTKAFAVTVEATGMNWYEDGSCLVMDLSSWDGSLTLNKNRESYVLFELTDSILGTGTEDK